MSLACQEAWGDGTGPMSTNPFTNQEEIIMKRQISVGMLLAVGLLIWGAGHPEQALSDKPCSLKTLKGTYLSVVSRKLKRQIRELNYSSLV